MSNFVQCSENPVQKTHGVFKVSVLDLRLRSCFEGTKISYKKATKYQQFLIFLDSKYPFKGSKWHKFGLHPVVSLTL